MTKTTPFHIGLIPDGTRRWAKKNNKDYYEAYWHAMKKLVELMSVIFESGVQIQSIYLLSKENLHRSQSDLEPALEMETQLLEELMPTFCQKWECSVRHAGSANLLPKDYSDALSKIVNDTDKNLASHKRKVYLLAAYNPWDEIENAISISAKPRFIRDSLWVYENLDLVIRTGHGQLISNFLPLQSGYAELYFIDKLFNDLDINDIRWPIENFPLNNVRLLGK